MTSSPGLLGSRRALCEDYDVALLDLDGVIYVGAGAVEHAVESVMAAAARGMRWAPVTNNALRPAKVVAEHLSSLGLLTQAAEVITSAHAAALVLSERLPPGARVLVCGGAGLHEALSSKGLVPVATAHGAADSVDGVVTGHDVATDYARLAETALALRTGLPWVASNTDANVPTQRGMEPGAGAVVAFLSTAAERSPDEVAGKPFPAMHRECISRTHAQRPLVVGDRLDTDIAGARAMGVASLAVLTGVALPRDLLQAQPSQRPNYLARDLRGLLEIHPAPVTAEAISVRSSSAAVVDGILDVRIDDPLDALRAACVCAWRAADARQRIDVTTAVQRLGEAIDR